jgi:type I site-specific restriction endonuclease
MPITPEDLARQNIDQLLTAAGWIIQDRGAANITAGRGVAIREFPMKKGHGEADYLLFVDGAAADVIEAKRDGMVGRGEYHPLDVGGTQECSVPYLVYTCTQSLHRH